MADVKISALAAAVNALSTMELEVNNSGTSEKVTLQQIKDDVMGGHSVEDAVNTGVSYPTKITHTVTGTPGVGVGVGMQFEAETSAGNNEIGATLEAVATDVTSTSEDFDLVVKTMQGGAAADEVCRFTSSGSFFIGYGSPLSVVSQTPKFHLHSFGNSTGNPFVFSDWSNAQFRGKFVFHKSRATSPSSHGIVHNSDYVMDLFAVVDDGSDHNNNIGRMSFTVDDASPDTGGIGGALIVQVSSTSGTLQTTIACGANGNTYIGGGVGASIDYKLGVGYDYSTTTNAVDTVFGLRVGSTGTPANGIGAGMVFDVETSTSNFEKGAYIEAVATDTTATSEDFDLVFRLMSAGATASEVLRLLSSGQLRLQSTMFEKVNALGSVSGSTNINTASGGVVSATTTAATTFTFTTASSAGYADSFTLHLTNGGTYVTWPSSVHWNEGVAPTLTTSGKDILVFTTIDGGTTWDGMLSSLDSKAPV